MKTRKEIAVSILIWIGVGFCTAKVLRACLCIEEINWPSFYIGLVAGNAGGVLLMGAITSWEVKRSFRKLKEEIQKR